MQIAWDESSTGLCRSHEVWARKGVKPDRAYEEKISRALLQPTWSYLTDTEAEASVNGRYRGDGRRLDLYVTDDGMGIDLDGLASA